MIVVDLGPVIAKGNGLGEVNGCIAVVPVLHLQVGQGYECLSGRGILLYSGLVVKLGLIKTVPLGCDVAKVQVGLEIGRGGLPHTFEGILCRGRLAGLEICRTQPVVIFGRRIVQYRNEPRITRSRLLRHTFGQIQVGQQAISPLAKALIDASCEFERIYSFLRPPGCGQHIC